MLAPHILCTLQRGVGVKLCNAKSYVLTRHACFLLILDGTEKIVVSCRLASTRIIRSDQTSGSGKAEARSKKQIFKGE